MKRKRLIAAILAILLIIVLVTWFAGTLLTSPVQHTVRRLPEDLAGRSVEFPSESGRSFAVGSYRVEPAPTQSF